MIGRTSPPSFELAHAQTETTAGPLALWVAGNLGQEDAEKGAQDALIELLPVKEVVLCAPRRLWATE